MAHFSLATLVCSRAVYGIQLGRKPRLRLKLHPMRKSYKKPMRAKKSLGQHFLTSPEALEKIVRTADLRSSDVILEVGPGKGILTAVLLQRVARVIAVEKDHRLIPPLARMFARQIKERRLVLLHDDIIEFNLRAHGLSPGKYKVVANIPYYITGVFLRRFLSSKEHPESMTLLVQKEVADRIIARDKKESLLSIGVKAFGTPNYIGTVRAGSFSPPPKVDSAILSITNISKSQFKNVDERDFFEILHAGFAHKRKQLSKNLALSFRNTVSPEQACLSCAVSPRARAEDLSFEIWKCLARYLKRNRERIT